VVTPTEITFDLSPTEDTQITCVVCYPTSHRPCEFEFTVKGDGKRTSIGVHAECLETLFQRNRQQKKTS
jgi:hypothetical protein